MTIVIDKYTTLKLERGKDGNYYLNAGWTNNEGQWRPTKIKRKFGKEEKEVGLSIKLGDQGLAPDVLTQLYEAVSTGTV